MSSHGPVGEALEALYPERPDELAPVLAMHFEQAGETPRGDHLSLAAAGEHALQAERHPGGVRGVRPGHEPDRQAAAGLDHSRSGRGSPRRRQAGSRSSSGARARASASWPSARRFGLARADRESRRTSSATWTWSSRVHMLIALRRLQAGARRPRTTRWHGRSSGWPTSASSSAIRRSWRCRWRSLAWARSSGGPIREGVAALEEAVPLMQQRKDSISAAFARGGLAVGYANLGEFDKANLAMANAKEIADQGDLIAQLGSDHRWIDGRASEDRLDLAVPLAGACVDRARDRGRRRASCSLVVGPRRCASSG